MSTLVAQTISNGTVSTSTANVINGAKAWAQFTSAGVINASYNVSSITIRGTAQYTINFTNAFTDTKYAFAGNTQSPSSNQVFFNADANVALTASALPVVTIDKAGTAVLVNCPINTIVVFR